MLRQQSCLYRPRLEPGREEKILGLNPSENEGAKYWLSVPTELNNSGFEDILIASVDGMTGFPDAINSIFSNTEIQLCVIQQIRNSLKYVASKKQEGLLDGLKSLVKSW